jgi:hypothetical protein
MSAITHLPKIDAALRLGHEITVSRHSHGADITLSSRFARALQLSTALEEFEQALGGDSTAFNAFRNANTAAFTPVDEIPFGTDLKLHADACCVALTLLTFPKKERLAIFVEATIEEVLETASEKLRDWRTGENTSEAIGTTNT